jgi:uncharacterized protein (TIGR02145 family)
VKILALILVMAFEILEAAEAESACNNGIFTDSRDNKIYKWVKIGKQTWMAENLAFEADDSCYRCKESEYGKRYHWKSAMKYCPKGWHLPSDAEWQVLVDFAGGKDVAGKKLKSKSGWEVCYNNDEQYECNPDDSNGTDEYGFSALPGGACFGDGGCRDVDNGGFWWSSTEGCAALNGDCGVLFRSMNASIDEYNKVGRGGEGMYCDFSVRCVKDGQPFAVSLVADTDYSFALQMHFAKGTLGESGKSRPVEMFFQQVSKNCDFYSISGKSKTKAAEDAFSGVLAISGKTAGGSCNSGETEIKGNYDLKEKKSKTSGRFAGNFTACEKNGKFSKASFKGNWVKDANGSKTPCNFEM